MTLQTYFTGISSNIDLLLQGARQSIKIAVAWVTNENLLNILCAKALQGIPIEIILINDVINNSDKGFDLNKLIGCGVKVYLAGPENLMHNKFCVIDDITVITGSFNWTYSAEKYNNENIIVINNSPEIVHAFDNEFNLLKIVYGEAKTIVRLKFTKESLQNSYLASIFETEKKEIARKDSVIPIQQIQVPGQQVYNLERIGFAERIKRFYLKLIDSDKKDFEFWPDHETLFKKLKEIKFIENNKINTEIIDNLFERHIDYFNKPEEQREPIYLPQMKDGDWPFPNLVTIKNCTINSKEGKNYLNNVSDFGVSYIVPKWCTLKDNGKEYFDWEKYVSDI